MADVLKLRLKSLGIKKNWDLLNNKPSYAIKPIEVRWDAITDKWYPVALFIMTKLVTDTKPVEFVTELLLPFTTSVSRDSEDPLYTMRLIDMEKFSYESKLLNDLCIFRAMRLSTLC